VNRFPSLAASLPPFPAPKAQACLAHEGREISPDMGGGGREAGNGDHSFLVCFPGVSGLALPPFGTTGSAVQCPHCSSFLRRALGGCPGHQRSFPTGWEQAGCWVRLIPGPPLLFEGQGNQPQPKAPGSFISVMNDAPVQPDSRGRQRAQGESLHLATLQTGSAADTLKVSPRGGRGRGSWSLLSEHQL
jgi:hypothetical protein